jgi:hypothetical protein
MSYSRHTAMEVGVARTRTYAWVIVFALAVTACGGSTVGSTLDQSSGTTAAPGTTDGSTVLPTGVGNIPGVSSECEALVNLYLSISAAFTGGAISAVDPATLANLPADVRADALLVSDTLKQYSDGLQALGIDFSDPTSFATMTQEQQDAFTALGDLLNSDEFQAASDRLSAYGDQQCASEFGDVP